MISSRVLIWIVLCSLGAAALLGAAGVLMGGQDFYWRAVGTLIVTAICSAFLFWASHKLTDRAAHPAAVLATLLVILEFILSLSVIWEINQRLFNIDWEYLVELILMILVLGYPAIICVRFIRNPHSVVACITGLILCVAVFVIWCVAMPKDEKYWETGNILVGFGFLLTLCLVGLGSDRRYWRWLGVIASVTGSILGILFIWQVGSTSFLPEHLTVALVGIAVWIAHANIAVRCPLRPGQKWIAWGAIAAVGLSMAFWNAAVWLVPNRYGRLNEDELVFRLACACGIVGACGTIALVILGRVNQKLILEKRQLAEALNVNALQAAITCPVCQRKLTLGSTGSSCPGCGLQMKLILEEPRCQSCGYSLLMNGSGRCPECGASAVPQPIPAV